MKRFLPMLLAVLLLALAGCQTPAGDASGAPTDPAASAPADSGVPVISAAPDSARYFFAEGAFLGSWDNGSWRGAADGGFTLGQLFNRDYIDPWGEAVGSARFHVGEGPNALSESSEENDRAIALLRPYGVVEGEQFVMYIPGQLSGEAADIPVPDYNFSASFNGMPYYLLSNTALTQPDMSVTDTGFTGEEVAQVLAEAGIDYYGGGQPPVAQFWQCDVDGDGQAETVALLQNAWDDDGHFILTEGEPIFYILAVRDEDVVLTVASHVSEHTDDVTAQFTAQAPIIADLDGDGMCELIIKEQGWEWGHYAVYSRVDGLWKEVLRANYGT